ncbi:hypothetical protein JW926_16590 [Candidatus Sumerlaeota bacterium]|nr:hypothetical protein [Candidatus Sumerlaeota bacterium]
MTPDESARYHEWKTTPLHFNPKDIEALPFQGGTKSASIKFREEWERHKKPALEIADEIYKYLKEEDGDPTKTISLDEEVSKFNPLIKSFKEIIERDDYEIDALVAGKDIKDMNGIPSSDYLQFQISIKILGLKAFQLMNDGKTSEALNMAEDMSKASRSHLYSTLICQLISISCHSLGTETWHQVVMKCHDPELIRSALVRQNKMVPHNGFLPGSIDLGVSDKIGEIRMANRFGITTHIDGKTGREIYGEWLRVQAEFEENLILPLFSDPPEIEKFHERISNLRKTSAVFGSDDISFPMQFYRLISLITLPTLYSTSVGNYEEAFFREKVALARYDLLRLDTAKKLYFLEHKKEPENMEDLVPGYIPVLLLDPFTEKEPFRKESFFYSIGPDKKDQKGAVFYDPTNGTTSSGDIFFIKF